MNLARSVKQVGIILKKKDKKAQSSINLMLNDEIHKKTVLNFKKKT